MDIRPSTQAIGPVPKQNRSDIVLEFLSANKSSSRQRTKIPGHEQTTIRGRLGSRKFVRRTLGWSRTLERQSSSELDASCSTLTHPRVLIGVRRYSTVHCMSFSRDPTSWRVDVYRITGGSKKRWQGIRSNKSEPVRRPLPFAVYSCPSVHLWLPLSWLRFRLHFVSLFLALPCLALPCLVNSLPCMSFHMSRH